MKGPPVAEAFYCDVRMTGGVLKVPKLGGSESNIFFSPFSFFLFCGLDEGEPTIKSASLRNKRNGEET